MSVFVLLAASGAGRAQAAASSAVKVIPAKTVESPLAKNLRALKKAENAGQATECHRLAKAVWKETALRGWVAISNLRCSVRADRASKNTTSHVLNPLALVDTHPELLGKGPWSGILGEESEKARLAWLEIAVPKGYEKASENVARLLEVLPKQDRENRARALYWAGELALKGGSLAAAADLFDESLSERDTKAARERSLETLRKLNRPPPEEKSAPGAPVEAEGNFEERFAGAQKSGDLINLLEDCVAYLNQFPNGRRAKWASEKATELLLLIVARADEGKSEAKAAALRDRAYAITDKLDFVRQGEWARTLHRRGEWAPSLRLAERALSSLGGTQGAAILLYVAGRSAQFLGDFAKSRAFFDRYVQAHAGAEDFPEVLFRLGLSYLRQKEYASAVTTFERLLGTSGNGRYELSSAYWLVRALEKQNSPRAVEEARKLAAKFPFSYYGMRLKSEYDGKPWEWPYPADAAGLAAAEAKPSEWTLNEAHRKAWDRAELLSNAGWSWEALAEIQELPLPRDPLLKARLARRYAAAEAYPLAIRLINEAGDVSDELRAVDWVSIAFPQIMKGPLEEEAKKNRLDPVLVRSLIRQESAYHPRAVSTSNAMGLMQLIPPTAKEVAVDLKLDIDLPEAMYQPELNVKMGTAYLGKLLRQFSGNVPAALAGYNAGPHRLKSFFALRTDDKTLASLMSSDPDVEIWFDELPWFETSFYVKAILRNVLLYRALDQGRASFDGIVWKELVLGPNSPVIPSGEKPSR